MSKEEIPEVFAFPIGILLFNSPEYSERVLTSLLHQSLGINPKRIVISIDGFEGSRSQVNGHLDNTKQVEKLARSLFPNSQIFVSKQNRGIAQQFELLEQQLYTHENSEWALFLEHDFDLHKNYLRVLTQLIELVDEFPRIVQVNCTGDTLAPLSRGANSLYPSSTHDWAYALRKSHTEQREQIMASYLEVLKGKPYFLRDDQKIYRALATHGVYPLATSQDAVKQSIRYSLSQLSVTTGRHYGTYIGETGEHFTPEIYNKMGYHSWKVDGDAPLAIEASVEELVEQIVREEVYTVARAANRFISDKLQYIDKIEGLLQTTQTENKAFRAENSRLKKYQIQLQQSVSWRVTTPLRAFARIFKR